MFVVCFRLFPFALLQLSSGHIVGPERFGVSSPKECMKHCRESSCNCWSWIPGMLEVEGMRKGRKQRVKDMNFMRGWPVVVWFLQFSQVAESRRFFHVFLLIARSVILWWANVGHEYVLAQAKLNDNVEGILSCSLAFQWNRSSAEGIRMKWGPICAIRKDDGFCRTGTAKECAFTEFIQGFCHVSTVWFEQTHFETHWNPYRLNRLRVMCAVHCMCTVCAVTKCTDGWSYYVQSVWGCPYPVK